MIELIFLKVLTLIKIYQLVKKCYLCGYWYFINKNFNYQKYMCNGCRDMSIKAISMHNLCIRHNNGNAYRINFVFMSKNVALNLIKNAVIIDKKKYYKAKIK